MFPLSLILLFAASTTAVPPVSKFVVPNFKDLTIKTRTTFGMSGPSLAISYFKGARQRSKHRPERLRGERRQMGSFDARSVKTSITVEPSKGAAAKPGTVEIDGWYIDLFGVDCRERDREGLGISLNPMVVPSDSQHDHVIIKWIGNG
jgi:hypothetical protein